MQLEADLRRAIAEGHLSLVYQPLYRLHDSRLMGFEALSRWTHPEFGAIGPDVFIPIAEETGLIVQITEFVLNPASAELKQWQQLDADFAGLTMNVNISAKDLAHGGLVARIMRTLGVALCVDDFGTGYSLLAYLGTLPIDSLKIDRSFVMALQEKRQNVEIVRAVLALAKSLGRKVIAEGIETNDQLTLLRQMGVQEGQGYLLSRPLRPEQVSALLAPPPAPVPVVENAETALAGQPPPRWV